MAFNGNRYLCTRCPFTTNTTSSIRLHNQKCHPALFSKKSPKVISRPKHPGKVNANMKLSAPSKVQKASTSAKKRFQCTECRFSTNSKKLLTQHRIVHIEEKYDCSQCTESFFTTSELNEHVNSDHLKESGPVKCDLCSQEFPRVISMTYHRRTHMQSQSFTCHYCQKIFFDVIAFRNHEVLHKGNNSKKKQ